jgi:hypothetical protein
VGQFETDPEINRLVNRTRAGREPASKLAVWGKKLWSFAVDLLRDGYAALGIIAAPLSIAFTFAKAFDVQALGHLREISYAWAFAPLTLWFFVAYVRLRAKTARKPKADVLQSFYVAVGPIITRSLSKDISAVDFENYASEADGWANSCADWIHEHLGLPARERFLDTTGMAKATFFGAVNPQHNAVIQNLTRLRQNLAVLIESNAWDKP